MKFVVVTGGVLSGLGKGVTASSIGLLLKSSGFAVSAIKCDMYLNIDAGTMNPIEHGEVFVTNDGLETDQDLGHYERFLEVNLNRSNYVTNGQIYQEILNKERALEYGGKCVEPYHHIPPEIIRRFYEAGRTQKADIVMVELGGTVGEYEGLLFLEAVRRLKLQRPKDVVIVHVGYLPAPPSIGELKSKPLQQSVSLLNSVGIQPDFIVGRAEKVIDEKRKEKIALSSGVPVGNIISNPDVNIIYEVPLVLAEQKAHIKILKKLGLNERHPLTMGNWKKMLKRAKTASRVVDIAVIGKYQKTGDYVLTDSYVCVVEALKHAGWSLGLMPKLVWIDSEHLESMGENELAAELKKHDAILVPQGWGRRGVEGKILAAKYARENKVPYLGLCFGMQMATIEFARNVLGLKGANSTEIDPDTKFPVIHTMESQKENIKNKKYGGTIRLGAFPCEVKKGTKLFFSYNPKPALKKPVTMIMERHRHRYEFNNKYRDEFEKAGLIISGTSPDGNLVEAVELSNHPFFVGTQFHPEYISRPLHPHPVFISFMKAASAFYDRK